MTQLLVRNIDTETLDCLKNRAKRHHRTLQGEIKFILEEAANVSNLRKTALSPDMLSRIVGGWQGESLTRSDQGDYEQRDELE
jgi:plasmid stability protein